MIRLARHRGNRWSDNDKYFGPFTFALDGRYKPFAIVFSSGTSDEEESGSHIRFSAFGVTMICELPQIVKPDRKWVNTSGYEWSKDPAGGYWDENPRKYGFSLSEGFLHIFKGTATTDSSTDRSVGYFLPWTQWRQVAHRLYHADGRLHADIAGLKWEYRQAIADKVVKAQFVIEDFDGERVITTVHKQERESRRGEGWFKWLGYLVPKRLSRYLEISFASEVGSSKGSWKGGLVGHSTAMTADDTCETALRRYCDQEHRSRDGKYRLRFVGPVEGSGQSLADATQNQNPKDQT